MASSLGRALFARHGLPRREYTQARLVRNAVAAAAALVACALNRVELSVGTTPIAWVGDALPAQAVNAKSVGWRQRRGGQAAAQGESTSPVFVFDPNSVVDRTEMDLLNTTLQLTSSVFGFPDFSSLLDLNDDGSVRFWGGMVARELGGWCVVQGVREEGENPDDLYIEFTQPLTERYKSSFTVPGGTCFWRGKLEIKDMKKRKVFVQGGVIVSEREEGGGTVLVREGVFTATIVDREAALETQKKAREAFERALMTPKGESTGFKTPARIAGMNVRRPRQALPGARDKDDEPDLEDD